MSTDLNPESLEDVGYRTENRLSPTVNVKMGSERLLVKPASERPWGSALASLQDAVLEPVGQYQSASLSEEHKGKMYLNSQLGFQQMIPIVGNDLNPRMDQFDYVSQQTSHAICHSTSGFVLIITTTVVTTILVCILVRILAGHLKRREFGK